MTNVNLLKKRIFIVKLFRNSSVHVVACLKSVSSHFPWRRSRQKQFKRFFVLISETCPCLGRLTTSWRPYAPYVNFTEDGKPGQIIPLVLQSMVKECCGGCLDPNQTVLDFGTNGRNEPSKEKLQPQTSRRNGWIDRFHFSCLRSQRSRFIQRRLRIYSSYRVRRRGFYSTPRSLRNPNHNVSNDA